MARQENRINRETAFKVYEWVAKKKEEIEQGKWALPQIAQFAGEAVGHLVTCSTISDVLKFQGINLPKAKSTAKNASWMAVKIKNLETRLGNLERQLGLKPVE